MAPGKVFDGSTWHEVTVPVGNTAAQVPVPPAPDGDGTIFIAIPSFRGESLVVVLLEI